MTLLEYREEIDKIDAEIVNLLKARFTIVEIIAKIKEAEGLPIENQEREAVVLDRIEELSGPNLAEHNRTIFSQIIKSSKEHQGRFLHSKY